MYSVGFLSGLTSPFWLARVMRQSVDCSPIIGLPSPATKSFLQTRSLFSRFEEDQNKS